MAIRLRRIQPFDDLSRIKHFATKEIINPQNQDKHILKYNAQNGALVGNDFFKKNSNGEYNLANSRYFGYKSMLKVTKDIETGDITERYSVCRDKSTHPYCTVKTRYIIYPDGEHTELIKIQQGHEIHEVFRKNTKIRTFRKEREYNPPISEIVNRFMHKLKDKLDGKIILL